MKKDKAIFIVGGDIQENMQHELSKKIDSVCKEFGLDSYLDDVVDNICEHNNTITNECSECNEDELLDYENRSIDDGRTDTLIGGVLTYLLPDIRNLIIDFNIRDRVYEMVGEWSKADFDNLMATNFDEDISDQIFKDLSMKNFEGLINQYKKEKK